MNAPFPYLQPKSLALLALVYFLICFCFLYSLFVYSDNESFDYTDYDYINGSPYKKRGKTALQILEDELFSPTFHVPQDDPTLINYIRHKVLKPPPSNQNNIILSPTNPHEKPNEQMQIYKTVINILKNQTGGFFIECGANDGEMYSNTLNLELNHNWSGLLIEPDPQPLGKLLKRNRKAWIAPVCLSILEKPMKITLLRRNNDDLMTQFIPDSKNVQVQDGVKFDAKCFPLFSLLTAIKTYKVDYFSLDIEGAELGVLQTIPWDKVISIEVPPLTTDQSVSDFPIHGFMLSLGYRFVTHIANTYSHDNIYVRE